MPTRGSPISGMRLQTLLTTYRASRRQGGLPAVSQRRRRPRAASQARRAAARGLPARVMPLEVFHIASLGIDRPARARSRYGASRSRFSRPGAEAPEYLEALKRRWAIAQTDPDRAGLWRRATSRLSRRTTSPSSRARTLVTGRTAGCAAAGVRSTCRTKSARRSISCSITCRSTRREPQRARSRCRPARRSARIERRHSRRCTLCMACVGACPEGALLDCQGAAAAEVHRAQLRAVRLVREDLPGRRDRAGAAAAAHHGRRKRRVVLNEARSRSRACAAASRLATRQMIDNMLAGSPAIPCSAKRGALERLQMCADCRVIDLMQNAKRWLRAPTSNER